MKCPKCDGDMQRLIHYDIEVDRCEVCKGLWFDALEKENLLKVKGAEVIDSGNPTRGQRYNKLKDIRCPRCNVPLSQVKDQEQVHIKFDSCPDCSGTFFDAGEFRDLKEFTVVERFAAMLRSLRD